MDMEILLKEFKERFSDDLLEIHWRQWSALGVASHIRPEEKYMIDLESLISSTLCIAPRDTRLFKAAIEWLTQYGEWLNSQRLKAVARAFITHVTKLKPPLESLIEPAVFGKLSSILPRLGTRWWSNGKLAEEGTEERLPPEYEAMFRDFRARGVATKPVIQNPPLLQLRLRAIFGVDARVELFIYFLGHNQGNSNSIAKEIYYDQKNIYRTLEKWHKAGILTKTREGKAGVFIFKSKEKWLHALGLERVPSYVNWTQIFIFLNRILKALSVPPWCEDEYMLSSFFRDMLNDAKRVGKYLGVSIPEADQYPGASYFSPFALKVLEVVECLKKGQKDLSQSHTPK